MSLKRACVLACWAALSGPASAGEPADPLRLDGAYRKGQEISFDVQLSVQDLLERDLWSTNDWKLWRERKIDWKFKLSLKVDKAPGAKGVPFQAVLADFAGAWFDKTPGDDTRPDVEVTFAPSGNPPAKNAKPAAAWEDLFAGWSGHFFEFVVGPRGGVAKVEGWEKTAARRFAKLEADPEKGLLAKDLKAWFSDPSWASILTAAFPEAPPPTAPPKGRKDAGEPPASKSAYPLPWGGEFGEKPLPAVSVHCVVERKEEGTIVSMGFQDGKIDQTLQFTGQPGFHSLGTEQEGKARWTFAPDLPAGQAGGLKSAQITWRAHDRWDNYRLGAQADRFERKATATVKFERVQ